VAKPIRIAIVACREIRNQNLCPGDAKCFTSLIRREGKFEEYKGKDAVIIGIIDCGGCPGTRVPASLGLLKMHLSSLNEGVDVVHMSTCIIRFCPYKDDIAERIRKICKVPIVEGTHEYITTIP